MRVSATLAETPVNQGYSWDLPLAAGAVETIVSTYPGRWILDNRTVREFERVLTANGRAIVLLGGTVERGRHARLRRAVLSLAYGSPARHGVRFSGLDGTTGLRWRFIESRDCWGTVYLLTAERS
jgi:hypothetical protein